MIDCDQLWLELKYGQLENILSKLHPSTQYFGECLVWIYNWIIYLLTILSSNTKDIHRPNQNSNHSTTSPAFSTVIQRKINQLSLFGKMYTLFAWHVMLLLLLLLSHCYSSHLIGNFSVIRHRITIGSHIHQLRLRVRLHQASASTLWKLCDDAKDTFPIGSNGVTPEWGCNLFSGESIVFKENSITSIITVLTLMLGVNGP